MQYELLVNKRISCRSEKSYQSEKIRMDDLGFHPGALDLQLKVNARRAAWV